MITKKKVKIDKEFAEHIYGIFISWTSGRLKYTTSNVVDSMHKLKELFGIEYKDTLLRRGIDLDYIDVDISKKIEIKRNKISMVSNFELQPWTEYLIGSGFFVNKNYDYVVEANIPAENILLSYDDRNLILEKLNKSIAFGHEREWMIYLPTKKIKLSYVIKWKK